MVRIGLHLNPGARGALERESVIAELARHGAEVVAADDPRAERVAVAGGDGTIGPVAADAGARGLPVALLPVGTANDLARGLGLPLQLAAACELAVTGKRTLRLDLGRMGSRPFVNLASAGLSPVAARRARGLKARLGVLAYAVGALRAGLSTPPLDCRITADGAALHAGPVWQAMVAVSGAFGGGAGINSADPTDGRLDVVVVPARGRAGLLAHALALRSGRIAERRDVPHMRAREVELSLPDDGELNVDGELVRAATARFTIEPGAYEVVVG